MRLVAVADTHTFHGDLVVPPGDLFIHAGDLCRGGELDELATSLAWMRALPHPHKVLVAGNHDWPFVVDPEGARALLGAGIHYLEDEGALVGGLRLWGSPWQPAFNDWAFNLPRGAPLAAKWAAIPAGLDVLVTHGPPRGIGDDTTTGGREGCADLAARVRMVRPRLHLFGHIHESGGLWERDGVVYANVTSWEGERGATVIDLEPGRPPKIVAVPPTRPR